VCVVNLNLCGEVCVNLLVQGLLLSDWVRIFRLYEACQVGDTIPGVTTETMGESTMGLGLVKEKSMAKLLQPVTRWDVQ